MSEPTLADVIAEHGPGHQNACICGAVIHDESQYRSHLAATVIRDWVVPHDAATEARVRAEALERAARAIEAKRNEHWQWHLAAHPLANGTSCPGDYAAHDAYHDAARIVRDLARGDA